MDVGAGVTIILLLAVTPLTDLVQVVVADQFATDMVTVTADITLCTAMSPLPKSDVELIVLMFVPLTNASCLPLISVMTVPKSASPEDDTVDPFILTDVIVPVLVVNPLSLVRSLVLLGIVGLPDKSA